ncbi:EAL domain-containing protein [Marinobacter sediminum]|uniref:EAL domain-containing protein n=1 Tax=Marinobacter sediminum TaxID=256323 RepID=UPI00193A148B|nr:EAL domain-containing protein [Marinobacter sediminum]
MLAALVAGLLTLSLWGFGTFENIENQARDLYVEFLTKPVASNLVVVEIDSASIAEVGRWPWPRTLYAEAIAELDAAGINSLMIDIDLSARSSISNDAALAQALKSFSRQTPVYLPAFVQRQSATGTELMLREPLPELAEGASIVSVNMHPEADGLVRKLSAGFVWQGRFFPGAWNALSPTEDRKSWIDFSLSPQSFQYISFIDLVNGGIDPQKLKGKDVLIGATAIELGDTLAVPIHRSLPGVVIHALGTETLNRGGLYSLSPSISALLIGFIWLLATLLFPRLSWLQGLKWLTVIAVCLPLAAIMVYQNLSLIVDFIAPLVAAALVYVTSNLARLNAVTLEHLWLQITLRDSETLHNRILATANDCILCVNSSGQITRANPAMQSLTQTPATALVHNPILRWLPEIEPELTNLTGKPFDTVLLDSEQRPIPVEATISTVELSNDPLFTVVLRDLTERVAREKELEYQANHDLLTGLLNRTALFRRINRDLSQELQGTVLFLNLDYFHEVNDTYGHDIGDQLLQSIAHRLVQALDHEHPKGCVARVGGDGFALWLPGVTFAEGGQSFCRHLLAQVEERLPLDMDGDADLRVFCTIGAAETTNKLSIPANESGQDDAGAEALLRKAADALRLAKADGIEIHRYSSADSRAAGQRLKLVPAIRENIACDAFNLLYQPKIDLATMQPFGCEALLRWPSDRGPMVPVMTLIEVAENSRQIAPLTRWVVQALLAQERDWQARGLPRHIAVNISARLIQDRHFISELQELLASSTGYFQFEFEITETALMSSRDLATELASSLSQTGSTLAIDDYGTGYSSLAYLKDLNASILKIDKSFVTNIDDSRDNQTIVRSTIKMAHELGMQVVAEGIETAADERFLQSLGCDFGQGYHYAKPLPVDELVQWLAEYESRGQESRQLSDLQPFRR